jgi:hypothetical protein
VVVLKPDQFIKAAAVHFKPNSNSLSERIRKASAREADVIEGLKSLDKRAPRALSDGTMLWEEEGLFYYKGKLYVPNDRALRKDVVTSCHDSCHDHGCTISYLFLPYLISLDPITFRTILLCSALFCYILYVSRLRCYMFPSAAVFL